MHSTILTRRKLLIALTSSAAAAHLPAAWAADTDWPTKSIKAVVPASAGGDTDFNARMIAKYFEQITKTPMIVTNVTGGGGTIALSEVEDSKPDGGTLFFGHTGQLIVTEVSGLRDVKFDANLDISCIPAVDKGSVLVAGPASNISTLADLIKLAKEKPGAVTFGTEFGGFTHLQGLLIAQAAGIDLKFVDVGSASDKITALLGKRIDIASIAFGPVKDYAATKRLTVLAQFGDPANPLLPAGIQTFRQQGVDMSMTNPYVIGFPKGTNPELVKRMSTIVSQIIENKEYQESLAKTYSQPITYFPAEQAVEHLNQIRDQYLPYKGLLVRK